MYLCIFIGMYVCMYVGMYVRMYVYMYICMYVILVSICELCTMLGASVNGIHLQHISYALAAVVSNFAFWLSLCLPNCRCSFVLVVEDEYACHE